MRGCPRSSTCRCCGRYTPADALTIANASCGTIAIFLCLEYLASGDTRLLWLAFGLMPLAFILDALDGRIALLALPWVLSPLGADLDSLSDVISFGVAPATLAFSVGLRGALGRALPLLLRRLWGQPPRALQCHRPPPSRMAGTGKVKYFEGTPIPTSVLWVLVLALALLAGGHTGDPVPFGVSGTWGPSSSTPWC